MPIHVGDIVQLKSGGPRMTVTRVQGSNVTSAWFDGTQQREGTFPEGALKESPDPKPQPCPPPKQPCQPCPQPYPIYWYWTCWPRPYYGHRWGGRRCC